MNPQTIQLFRFVTVTGMQDQAGLASRDVIQEAFVVRSPCPPAAPIYALNRHRFLIAELVKGSVVGPIATVAVRATPARSIVSFTRSPIHARPILFLNANRAIGGASA